MASQLSLDVDTTALVVIDMQRYFTQPDFPLGKHCESIVDGGAAPYFERVSEIVIPNIQKLLSAFRATGAPVVFTEFGSHALDGSDLPAWARRFNEDTQKAVGAVAFPPFADPSARTDDRLKPQPGEAVLQKTTTGTVASSPVDHNLRARGIRSVIVTGVATDYCVSQTARELADRDFDVAIAEDACAAITKENHPAALAIFSAGYGWVLSSEEISSALNRS